MPRPLYHGTSVANVTHILPAAEHGGRMSYEGITDPHYAYATHNLDDAWEYAMESAQDERRPRVYQVHPIGGHQHVEDDPEYDEEGHNRGIREEDKRSRKGFHVLQEMKAPAYVRKWYDDETWGKD